MGCCGSDHCTCKKERNIKRAIFIVLAIVVGTWMWYMSQESVQRKHLKKAASVAPVAQP